MKRKKLFGLWLISTLFAAVAGALILEVPRFYLLTKRGVAVEGSLIALEPEKHGAVMYGYRANGRAYQGSGQAGDIDSRFDDLRVGQKVNVFYDPRAESVSCLGDPQRHLYSMLRGNAS